MRKIIFLLVFVVLACSGYAAVDSYFCFYDFTTSADDYGAHYNGTINGATHTSSGIVDYGYSFDGSNDNIAITDVGGGLSFTDAVTISVWFKPNSMPSLRAVVEKNYDRYGFQISNTAVRIVYRDQTGTPHNIDESYSFTAGKWYHAVLIINASKNATLWINNSLVTTQAFSGTSIGTTANPLYIGSQSSSTLYFNGTIDEVVVYNRELNPDEIHELYTYKRPYHSTYYVNQSGNFSWDGTLINFPMKNITALNSRNIIPGDTIYLAKGQAFTAEMNDRSGNATHPITYDSYGTGNYPTLDSQSLGGTEIDKYIIFKHLQFNTTTTLYDHALQLWGSDNITIDSCIFEGHSLDYNGIQIWHYNGDYAENITIKNSLFKNFGDMQVDLWGALQIYEGSRHVVARNNTFYNNTEFSIQAGSYDKTYLTYDVLIENNTIYSNSTTIGRGINIGYNTSNITVRDNRINGTRYGLAVDKWCDIGWYNVTGNIVNGALELMTIFSEVNNLSVTHNTFIGGVDTVTGVWYRPSQLIPSADNIFRDNIILGYANSDVELSINWTYFPDTLTDYNLFYKTTGDPIRVSTNGYYGDYWYGLASWQTTGNDTNSIEANPLFISLDPTNESFAVMYSNSPGCTASSTGSYVGALPCALDTTPPTFSHALNNYSLTVGYVFAYDINATDNVAVDCFQVNDSNFDISCTGYLNASALTAGTYYLNVSVNDTSSNVAWKVMYVLASAAPSTASPSVIETDILDSFEFAAFAIVMMVMLTGVMLILAFVYPEAMENTYVMVTFLSLIIGSALLALGFFLVTKFLNAA